MRISLHNPYFWPEVRRGSERVIDQLATGFATTGFEPSVIVGASSASSGSSRERGYDVIRVRRLGDRPLRKLGFHEPMGHLPLASRALKGLDPQLAHAFYPTDAVMTGRWARAHQRPNVFSLMGMPAREALEGRRARRELWRRAIDSADALVVLSGLARERLEWLSTEMTVIHPGVDLETFRPTSIRSERPTILCPAAIDDPRKRIGLLVDAFEIVRETIPDATLVLSKPRARSPLARKAANAAGVAFRDMDETTRLVDEYSSAWLTVLPSIDEAFGLVLAESLACGTPAAGSRGGGAAEIIDGEHAGVVIDEPATPQSVASAIVDRIREAPAATTRELCRKTADRFSAPSAVAAHVALYASLGIGSSG